MMCQQLLLCVCTCSWKDILNLIPIYIYMQCKNDFILTLGIIIIMYPNLLLTAVGS